MRSDREVNVSSIAEAPPQGEVFVHLAPTAEDSCRVRSCSASRVDVGAGARVYGRACVLVSPRSFFDVGPLILHRRTISRGLAVFGFSFLFYVAFLLWLCGLLLFIRRRLRADRERKGEPNRSK
jgi:hypothetical protein